MARPVPPDPPALTRLKPPREPFLSAEIHVVTPMFGGGAVAGVPDMELPIHGASVRGNLRFWWRACHGTRFASARELFEAEAVIWGQAASGSPAKHGPRPVEIVVEIVNPGKLVEPQQHDRGDRLQLDRSFPSYVVFPFQGKSGRDGQPSRPAANCLRDIIFRVRFTRAAHVEPDDEPRIKGEVEDALWAWVNFGGVGSRTRRGCGALFCRDYAPVEPLDQWFQRTAGQRVDHGRRDLPIPVLSDARVAIGEAVEPPVAAWRTCAQWLQHFRQGVNYARNPGQQSNRPGRSRWPEPDSVRDLLQLHDPRHQPVHPARPLFPRADLGLPLIFQRMGDPRADPVLDVSEAGASRFASPIIVKPLALGPDRAVPMVIVLHAPYLWEVAPDSVKLRHGKREASVPAALLNEPRKNAAVPPLQGESTAREAFLKYVHKYVQKKADCVEVTL